MTDYVWSYRCRTRNCEGAASAVDGYCDSCRKFIAEGSAVPSRQAYDRAQLRAIEAATLDVELGA